MPAWIQWLLGIDTTADVAAVGTLRLGATWLQHQSFWVLVAALSSILGSWWYYFRIQGQQLGASTRWTLTVLRSTVLLLLIVTLCLPVLPLTVHRSEAPTLTLLVDATESMAIEDRLSATRQGELANAAGVPMQDLASSREGIIRQWLNRRDNPINQLLARDDCRVEAYMFGSESAGHLTRLTLKGDEATTAGWSAQITADGSITAIGLSLVALADRSIRQHSLGTIIVSDFAHNSGQHPLAGDSDSPAARLHSPIYTIGIGAESAVDASIELQTDPKMKLAEQAKLTVRISQTGLDGKTVRLRVTHNSPNGEAPPVVVRDEQITLQGKEQQISIEYVPQTAGLAEFKATIAASPEEISTDNNTTRRSVPILDDFLRLMYVAHEPTWEWRFIKEVFHRDPLVGMRGFRTFLSSSDPDVRESNELFLPTMTPARSEFFANDVLFLEDMPAESLTPRFCAMVEQFVSELGGGLVVMVGPRFGGQGLRESGINRMLPVILRPDASIDDANEFALQRTPSVSAFDFMSLSSDAEENSRAWNLLNRVPWYLPVQSLAPDQATVLARHPSATLSDGKTAQPIIAHRRYGKGQVVYLGFNETWRLRRRYGEKYYRQFWSQLIYELGMSHALGHDKRFVPVLGRQRYEVEDRLHLRVEAYDRNYQPLRGDEVSGGVLQAQLLIPQPNGTAKRRDFKIPFLQRGIFETEVQLFEPGEYRVGMLDPIENEWVFRPFYVTDRSAERQQVVRNTDLQNRLALETKGKSFDLTEADRLIELINPSPILSTNERDHALWKSPLWFILLTGLLLTEWFIRKQAHLT